MRRLASYLVSQDVFGCECRSDKELSGLCEQRSKVLLLPKLTRRLTQLLPWSREIVGTPTMTPSPHASQYPAPPDGQDPHYTPLYPSAQVLDGQPPRVAYPQDAAFPKLENINQVLQAQQAQQALQANHALSASQQSKPNRLRKACDSCSIRKVKAGSPPPPSPSPHRAQ